MTSPLAEQPAVLGSQTPRIAHIPTFTSSSGDEAIELVAGAGLVLDPWEAYVLAQSLNEREDGKWAARDVGLVVPRQNGKDEIIVARTLAGLFLLDEMLITHSAHQFDTSLEAFRRLLFFIENHDDFRRRVKRVSRSHGEEGIELNGGQRVRFRTRTRGGGRGFTGDCLFLNEAMILPEAALGALLPTLSARPNPQLWFTGSPVDQEIHDDGLVFSRVRKRGLEGDPRLAYFEWSVDAGSPEEVDEALALDPGAWGQANPGLGIRILPETVESEYRQMAGRTFAVERLGVGDWPDPDGEQLVVPLEHWMDLRDDDSQPLDPVQFTVDVTPARTAGSIGVAGRRSDGLWHVEVAERGKGTGWIVPWFAERRDKHHMAGDIIVDSSSPAASLIPEFKQHGIKVEAIQAKEHAQACGFFFDAVEQRKLRHLGTQETVSALKGAAQRPLGDAWAWSRKISSVDISPLVAITLALWGIGRRQTGGGFEW